MGIRRRTPAANVGLAISPPPKETCTQRLFSTFPARWPGVGLLLLRAAVGLTAVVEGAAYLATDGEPAGALAGGLLLAASGALLLAGFLTPVAGVGIGSCLASLSLGWFPEPTPNMFDDRLTIAFAGIVAFAIVLLGPGAYSFDSYLFGRREIVIAARPRS